MLEDPLNTNIASLPEPGASSRYEVNNDGGVVFLHESAKLPGTMDRPYIDLPNGPLSWRESKSFLLCLKVRCNEFVDQRLA